MVPSLTFSLGRGFLLVATLSVLIGFSTVAVSSPKVDKAKLDTASRRAGKAAKALTDISALPLSETIPGALLERARGVAVFPDVDRLNMLVVKAMKGYGLMSRRLTDGWSMPAFYGFAVMDKGWTKLKPAEAHIIMLFMDDSTLKRFQKDHIDLKAAAGPVGELTPQKEKELLGAGIIIYALSDGKLRGIEVEDDSTTQSGINSDNNINKAVYGLKASEVLWSDAPSVSTAVPGITEFRNALTSLSK